MVLDTEMRYLRRCLELAREALDAGDAPFGSVLVDSTGRILKEDRNRVQTGRDLTLHPEFTLAQWASQHLSPEERAAATIYTSGEHCPMCSTLHAYAGLGRIVYVASAQQFVQWRAEFGGRPSSVHMHPINDIAPGVLVEGPVPQLEDDIRELHRLKAVRTAAK